jgi:hypothetical protein
MNTLTALGLACYYSSLTRDGMRILVVEDERKVANFIKKGLEEEHYAVDNAYDGESGLYMAEVNEYDLIVLGKSKQCPDIGADRQGQRGRYCEGFRCRL